MTKVFLVIREDRHVSDEITVHETLQGAIAALEEFKDRYDPDTIFLHAQIVTSADVLRYEHANYADGPKVRIQSAEVER